ncbi:NACHT domain-containing protein [Streptosporangium sp. NPDC002607]
MSVIAQAVAVAAAKAATGLAVQASAPTWKALLERLRPAPRALKKIPAWQETKLTQKQIGQARKYLESRFFTGLVQILTYVSFSEYDTALEIQVEELRTAFKKEFLSKVDGADEISSLANEVWEATLTSVKTYVEQIRKSEHSPELQIELNALASRRNSLVQGSSTNEHGHDRSHGGKNSLTVMSIVGERVSLSARLARAGEISLAIRAIRESAKETHAFLYMPHSKDQYRVPIEKIYVSRNLMKVHETDFSEVRIGSASSRLGRFATNAEHEEGYNPIREDSLLDQRYVLIGNPGAGKSTFIRHLMFRCSTDEGEFADIAPMIFELKNYPFENLRPFPELIAERIRAVDHVDIDGSMIGDLLTVGGAIVVFDGLDEVIDLSQRRQVVDAIESFCRRYPLTRLVVTSREEGYVGAKFNSSLFSIHRIPDFSEIQVEEYSERWFSLASAPGEEPPPRLVQNFLRDSAHASDLRSNPLMLSLLCMLYKYEGYIPENRPRVYEECAELLFDRWDRVKHVPQVLSPEAKSKNLVQELAYFFFSNQSRQGGVAEYIVARVLRDYLSRNVVADAETAESRAKEFLDYCAGRAWLLTKVGVSERNDRLFGFTHRTFLEYFVACYLVRHHSRSEDLVDVLKPMIRSGSSSVIPEIAILRHDELTADGADDCLSLLVFDSKNLAVATRVEYLPFALSCLRFMRLAPHVLRKIYYAALENYSYTRSAKLLDLMAYARGDSQHVLRQICEEVASRTGDRKYETLALQHACYALTVRIDAEWANDISNQLQQILLRRVPDLVNDHPDVLLSLIDIGALSLHDFLNQAPAHYLIGIEVHHGAKPTFIGGPFSVEFARFLSGGIPGDGLIESMRLLYSDPRVVMPMPKYAASHLYSLVDRMEQEDVNRLLVDSAKILRRPMKSLALIACLLYIEFDVSDMPDIVCALMSRTRGRRITEGLRDARNSTGKIDSEIIGYIDRLNLAPSWIDFLHEWGSGEKSAAKLE